MANLEAVLQVAGSGLDRIVKVTIYLTDMGNFPKIVELRARYFSPPYPADTIVEVNALALPELEIEIEAIALVGGEMVEQFNTDFADILDEEDGTFRLSDALPQESDEPHLAGMPRLIFAASRGKAGRIRELINCLNEVV